MTQKTTQTDQNVAIAVAARRPPTLAIVGRPNVGKSTLFNRLLRAHRAITHDRAGVTRDRVYAEARLNGADGVREVALIDTGGIEVTAPDGSEESIEAQIALQAREAVSEAHALCIVVDGRQGPTALDEEIVSMLRGANKPVLVVVNKTDGAEYEHEFTAPFHAWGFDVTAVSSAHGFGMNTLHERMAAMVADVPDLREDSDEEAGLKVAFLGRPNAGKSSLTNRIIGSDRQIVSDEAGTTRDTVDIRFEIGGKHYTIIDTAGVRRRTKVVDSLERFSVVRAIASARRAHVAVLTLDATAGLTTQDKKLLSLLEREKVGFIIAVNKADLVERSEMREFKKDMEYALRICPHAPVIYTSALTGTGAKELLKTAEGIYAEAQKRVGTGELNRVLREVLAKHQPPLVKRKRAKFYYMTQTGTEPLEFVFFVNNPALVKDSYVKYMENQLRKLFRVKLAPIRIVFRASRDDRQKW